MMRGSFIAQEGCDLQGPPSAAEKKRTFKDPGETLYFFAIRRGISNSVCIILLSSHPIRQTNMIFS